MTVKCRDLVFVTLLVNAHMLFARPLSGNRYPSYLLLYSAPVLPVYEKESYRSVVRGNLKLIPNTGKRRRALINAVEPKGLPQQGVDPAGTSAKCFVCDGKLERDTIQQAWDVQSQVHSAHKRELSLHSRIMSVKIEWT